MGEAGSKSSIYDEIIEEIRKRLQKELEEWWSYEKLKAVGGYLGICVLITLYKLEPFDKTSQWIKASKVPKATFYLIRKELIENGLATEDGKRITKNGERMCKLLGSLGPIISRAKFYEMIRSVGLSTMDRR